MTKENAPCPSRRALLGAIIAAPAAGLLTAIPVTAIASSNGAEWHALKARHDAAKAEEDAFNHDICDPAEAELEARCGNLPQFWFDVTAKSGETARYWVYPPDFRTVPFPPFTTNAERIKAEWARRDALIAIWEPGLNLEAIRERSEALDHRRYDLEQQLLRAPAPDLPALRWKLENLFGCSLDCRAGFCDSISMELVGPLIEDSRRMLGGEGKHD